MLEVMPDVADRDWAEGYTLTKPEGLMAHFTSAATAFEHILIPGGKLRLGRYGRMQDPAENKDVVPNFRVPSEPPDAPQRVEAAFTAHRDRMRVLCLTRDADVHGQEPPQFDCCWARPRMWEQYGDRHRGVCLLFDTARLEHAISEACPEQTIYKGKVDYSREGIARSDLQQIFVVDSVADEDLSRVVSEYTDTHHDALFFLKNEDFATEFEYRIVVMGAPDQPGEVEVEVATSLVAVVLGERFPHWQRAGAIHACSRIRTNVGLMAWTRGHPRVVRMIES
jgi:hypothetical protein